MSGQLSTWKRLAGLYQMMEERSSEQLQFAIAEKDAAEDALAIERQASRDADDIRRRALSRGERVGLLFARSQCELALRNVRFLAMQRALKEERVRQARERFMADRMESRKVQALKGDLEKQVAKELDKKEQSVIDDGFATRKRWVEQVQMQRHGAN